MLRLHHRLQRSALDRGAVGILVALLFGGGALLGMGALVVDVGGMYAERAQLQNGADAGAMAVAGACAKATSACVADTSTAGLAGRLANHNSESSDSISRVDQVCGRNSDPAHSLPACAGPQPFCPAPPATGNYVQVQTSTLNSDGTTLLPSAFGRALSSVVNPDPSSRYVGERVAACAQASWGAPSALNNAVPITISGCEWNTDTVGGTTFASTPNPPWPAPWSAVWNKPSQQAGAEAVLVLHGQTSAAACSSATDTAGWDQPGVFGWVGGESNCSVAVSSANTYPANTGSSALSDCASLFNQYLGKTIYVPVYSGVNMTGNNAYYTLAGFGAFVLTGWNINGGGGWSQNAPLNQPSVISNLDYCNTTYGYAKSDTCVYGFFTQTLIPASAVPSGSGTNLGATSVQLTG